MNQFIINQQTFHGEEKAIFKRIHLCNFKTTKITFYYLFERKMVSAMQADLLRYLLDALVLVTLF